MTNIKKTILIAILLLSPISGFCLKGEVKNLDEIKQKEARDYREQGYKLQMAGNFDSALVLYEKSMALDPLYAEVRNDIGVVYENMGDIDKAIEMYKRTLEIDKSYMPAYTNLAFIYEKSNDVKNASIYWKKRYDFGVDGEYWKEVARQHLLKLGAFPDVRAEHMQEEAIRMSKAIVFEREQSRLKAIEEASMHYTIGVNHMTKGDLVNAIKEFETAKFLQPDDPQLLLKISELQTTAQKALLKEQAKAAAEAALNSIKVEDYDAANAKLRETSELVAPLSRGTANTQKK